MKFIALCVTCVVCWASSLQAADLLSGTWTAGDGSDVRTYIFKVSGDRITGLVCGTCDDPASVFRIEDGRILDANQAVFYIRYDVGGPEFRRYGPYRQRVDASIARNQVKLVSRPEADPSAALTSALLTRVVANFELSPLSLPPAPASSQGAATTSSSIEGRWVSVGRAAQQNWILKVKDNKVWGLVCGPCTPSVVAMIDDGRIDGETITFYINHLDTPPDPARQGIQRNVMTGKISGSPNANVMRFTWVRERSPEQTGEIVMIGPVR
jgi:hypothetical protein